MTFRYDNLEDAIPDVRFVVEATSFEKLKLWQQYKYSVSWEENLYDFMPTIGELCGRPIVLSISFAKIHGEVVMFYEACSQLVDYLQVDDWLVKNVFPSCGYDEDVGGCYPGVYASNFHNCVHRMKELQENKETV